MSRTRDDDRFRRRLRRSPTSATFPRKKRGMPAWVIVLIVMAVLCVISVPIMIGLLLPAVQKVREAAGRAKEVEQSQAGWHRPTCTITT